MDDIATCTFGIVMTSYFEQGELPDSTEQGIEDDVASWEDIWKVMEDVYQRCVENGIHASWDYIGKYQYYSLRDVINEHEAIAIPLLIP